MMRFLTNKTWCCFPNHEDVVVSPTKQNAFPSGASVFVCCVFSLQAQRYTRTTNYGFVHTTFEFRLLHAFQLRPDVHTAGS